jgi:hypothetical protein
MRDLIKDRLLEVTGKKRRTILGFIFSSVTFTEDVEISIPEYEYLRAEVFVSDVRKLSGDSSVQRLDVHRLMVMLFEDFVENVRHGTDMGELIADLRMRKHRTQPRELKRVSSDHWKVKEMGADFEYREKRVTLTLEVPKDTLYRAQVLLRDLWEYDQTANWTVESLMTLLVLDLIREVKRGNGGKFAQSIVVNLEEYA